MAPSFQVTCAVPRAGRTLTNFLNKLKAFGANAEEIDQILVNLKDSKTHSSPDFKPVLQFLEHCIQNGPDCFSIYVDRKRPLRPYRVGFLGYEWDLGDLRIRVEGEEPHNGSSLIKLDEIDFTLVGLDELLSMTQHYLSDPTKVNKWGMYNYHLAKPTSIRVAGSAMLTSYNKALGCEVQDIVGFFLISKKNSAYKKPLNFNNLASWGHQVFVKGRYSGIVQSAYPKLKIVAVKDVEDAVMESPKGCVGLEIVQSGSTVKRKGLVLHGAPLFLSESLYVVDYDRYQKSGALRKMIEKLKPVGYFEPQRMRQFALWYRALELNLGDAWLNKPDINQLFCEPNDPEMGLRPYRLKTRLWKPSDQHLLDEAHLQVKRAHEQLKQYYLEVVQQHQLKP